MAFFLIVPSVMVVSIVLIHGITQRFGLKIKYRSLILCAVLSLVVNIAAIKMSTYLDKWHFVRLGILIMAASLAVTLFNRFLIKREKLQKETERAAEISELAEDEIELSPGDEIESEKPELLNFIDDKPLSEATPEVTPKVKPEPKLEVKPPIKSDIKPDIKLEIKSELKSDIKPEFKAPVKSEIKPELKPEIKSELKSDIKPEIKPKTKPEFKAPVKPELKPELKPEIKSELKSDIKPEIKPKTKPEFKAPIKPELKPKAKFELKPKSKLEGKPTIKSETKPDLKSEAKPKVNSEQIDEINNHLDSLDSILDYAYAEKQQGHLRQAILAYQKALERYKNDEYAPFIAIDLGNIYKEQAAYTMAIKTYEEALNLPAVIRNKSTNREFMKNLAYLKVVQMILVKHRAITTPFSKIPRPYLDEIETTFQMAQLKASRSKIK